MSPVLVPPPAALRLRCARAAIGPIRGISHSEDVARQSPGISVHMTTRWLSSRATGTTHGFRVPKGGRNHRGGAPVAATME